MKLFYSDHFQLPLPNGHRFPMRKYGLLRERVLSVIDDYDAELESPQAASDRQLRRVHSADYLSRVVRGQLTIQQVRSLGFPWSPQLVERSRRSCSATIEACQHAAKDGCAINLAGGTHHAFHDCGRGFCVFNDSAVAARELQRRGIASRIAIVDCDVHQGDGTASIFSDDSNVFTFSIHGAYNYPLSKIPGDLDLAIEDGTQDYPYLDYLDSGLRIVLDEFRPDFVIYVSGADAYHDDRLGRLALSKEGLITRDRMVLEACHEQAIPVAISMAGGYALNIGDTVDIHFGTVRQALELFAHFRINR